MQPLKAANSGLDSDGATPVTGSRRLVLPRFLRRPARALSRVDWRLPRNAGTKGVIALFLATGVAGVVIGGHGMTVASAATAWFGLGIDEVEITGQSDASEVDILDRLAMGPYPSLLTYDLDAARERVESLPWIETATLAKLFPNTLQVKVTERRPTGIWQHDGDAYLIDENGQVIAEGVRDRYRDLPYVVGDGAGVRINEFTTLLATAPDLAERVKAGVLVSERRWTLVLDNGIELMLPEKRPEVALATIERLDAEKALLEREIAAVDFRFDNKAIVRLTERGIEERKALLKQRARDAKRRAGT